MRRTETWLRENRRQVERVKNVWEVLRVMVNDRRSVTPSLPQQLFPVSLISSSSRSFPPALTHVRVSFCLEPTSLPQIPHVSPPMILPYLPPRLLLFPTHPLHKSLGIQQFPSTPHLLAQFWILLTKSHSDVSLSPQPLPPSYHV